MLLALHTNGVGLLPPYGAIGTTSTSFASEVLSRKEAIDVLLEYYEEQKLKPSEAALIGKPPNRRKKVIVLPSEKMEIREAVEVIRQKPFNEDEWLLFGEEFD